jgi:ankyrin repeat protein
MNLQNKRGRTALTIAIDNGYFDIVKALIRDDANVNLGNIALVI